MVKYKFVDAVVGVAKESGRPYSFVKLSDGLSSFTVANPNNVPTDAFKKGQDVNVDFTISAGYKGDAVVSIAKIS